MQSNKEFLKGFLEWLMFYHINEKGICERNIVELMAMYSHAPLTEEYRKKAQCKVEQLELYFGMAVELILAILEESASKGRSLEDALSHTKERLKPFNAQFRAHEEVAKLIDRSLSRMDEEIKGNSEKLVDSMRA